MSDKLLLKEFVNNKIGVMLKIALYYILNDMLKLLKFGKYNKEINSVL